MGKVVIDRVVFVCAGNICRSPIAEHAMRRTLLATGVDGIGVTSFGLVAQGGDAPVASTLRAATGAGLDLRSHRARRFDASLVRAGDLACVMEASQREAILAMGPLPLSRVALLGSFAPGPSIDIADPEDGGDLVFSACVSRILACVESLAKVITIA